jgi:ribosomal protein S27AE
MISREEYHEHRESQESLIDREEPECPMCGSRKTPRTKVTTENTDADGNRGLKMKTITCVDCGYEYIF